jgi:peroxiredoxin
MQAQQPSRAEHQEWAQVYNLNHPVLSDENFNVAFSYVVGNSIALPSFSLLRSGAQVVKADSWVDESDIIANLP